MGRRWDNRVLYHAVSAYQLLEAMLHRRLCHPREWAALLLPDFIVGKYPHWRKLEQAGFFDRVRLFPYLRIPHREEEQVRQDAVRAYGQLDLPPLETFSARYVAGAHFYFTLCLVEQNLPFSLWEDAAGTLCRPEREAAILARKFPRHAAIAARHGLFSGRTPLVREILCCRDAQTGPVKAAAPLRDFSVEQALEELPPRFRRRMVRFFLPRSLTSQAKVILLTQQFSHLGMLNGEEQRNIYRDLAKGPLRGVPLLVKKHPDDPLKYGEVFPEAQLVERPFPAELLPYVFRGKRPGAVWAFGSAGLANLQRHFTTVNLPLPESLPPLPPWEGFC